MQLIDNIPVWNTPDEGAMKQIKVCAKTAVKCALMGDHHKGYAVPIGGVVAYKDFISPSGVGYDIGCGNKAVRLNTYYSAIARYMPEIMDKIVEQISFGMGRNNKEDVDHDMFYDREAWNLDVFKERPNKHFSSWRDMARAQLGTVGSGNHYVDIFYESMGAAVWVGVHFGSRGLGHKIATWFLKQAGAKDGMDVEPCLLSTKSDLGQQYIKAMQLAGRYAYAGRDWVCQKVSEIIGASIVEEVHNHHNYAWYEPVDGQMMWVVRKGATPAYPGQRGFVGSSMAEPSVIIEGVAHPDAELAMYSTVHGAGRVMGRIEAAGKYHRKTGALIRLGKVTKDMMRGWIDKAKVELRGGGLDESPDCYKRLNDVLKLHSNTIKVVKTLIPIGVAMAGADEFDPYKD